MNTTSRRAVIAGAGALAATGAAAQTPSTAPTPLPRVRLETAQGAILVELAVDKAPLTAANFLRYVDAHRFDGASFYRAVKVNADPLMGLLQGGLQNDPAKTFPPIAHESTKVTGLAHVDGALSMARNGPGTAAAEFFICVGGPFPSMDASATGTGDVDGFAVFGRVVEGMDVVRTLLRAPVSPTKGADYDMAGQILEPAVTIARMTRV